LSMQISRDTNEVLDFLDYFTGNNLRKKNDLGILLEISAVNSFSNEISDMIFNFSYLWKLNKSLSKTRTNETDTSNLKKEYSEISSLIISQIQTIIDNSEEEVKERFEKVYFGSGIGFQRNLLDLAHDFAGLKELQNEMKRNL
jgi:hypothetical protein